VSVIVTGKLKISTSRRHVLSDIDLRQTRFRMDCRTKSNERSGVWPVIAVKRMYLEYGSK